MSLLVYVIFGGIVGWVASLIMRTDANQGIFLNIVVGIFGALLGSWLFGMFGEGGVTGFNLYSFIVALVGAIVLIAIVRAVSR